jgi:hypothetical protein
LSMGFSNNQDMTFWDAAVKSGHAPVRVDFEPGCA